MNSVRHFAIPFLRRRTASAGFSAISRDRFVPKALLRLVLIGVFLVIQGGRVWAEESNADLVMVSQRYTVEPCKTAEKGPLKSPESCLWWFRAKDRKLNKLVIYFAGAEQSCGIENAENTLVGYGRLAQSYVKRDFLFVCANLFEKPFSPWTTRLPYNEEASRLEILVKDITTHPDILKRWTGERLLFSGTGHGATTPVVAMKHGTLDNQPYFRGTKTTAACFLDGQYDAYFNQLTWLLPENQASCGTVFERDLCTRYTGKKDCDVQTRNIASLEADTIVGVDTGVNSAKPDDFAILRWKLVECGSELATCGTSTVGNNDVFPAPPIRALCDLLNTASSAKLKRCVYASEPKKSHTQCGLQGVADIQCINWFDSLPEMK